MALHIVLVEPEIPPNTGNIARTCAATGSVLHLVEPLGFSIDDRYLRRAGLDYWPFVKLELHPSLAEFLEQYEGRKMYFATTKAKHFYTEMRYQDEDFLVFGKETQGLPKDLIAANPDTAIRIPMGERPELRSLNLGNSVGIVVYEALRQLGFPHLY